jgi:hypothetical protein
VTITLTDAGARNGTLFVASSRPLALVHATGCEAAALDEAAPGVYKITLAGRQRGTAQTIRLEATQP